MILSICKAKKQKGGIQMQDVMERLGNMMMNGIITLEEYEETKERYIKAKEITESIENSINRQENALQFVGGRRK